MGESYARHRPASATRDACERRQFSGPPVPRSPFPGLGQPSLSPGSLDSSPSTPSQMARFTAGVS